MGAASAGVQSPQSSMPAGKGAGASPSTPAGSVNSTTMSATSGQPTMGAPNTNSNTGLGTAPAGKGGSSMASPATPATGTPTSSYIAEPDSFQNLDASGNPVSPMRVPTQFKNTVGSTGGPTDAMKNAGVGKGGTAGAAGASQGKGP
jgi:hypothetical protein